MEFVIDNKKDKLRFEISLGGEYAFIEYRWYRGNMALMHTVVPKAYQGHGIASAMAKYALEYVQKEGLKVIVFCPFIAKYIKLHPEYRTLIIKW